MAKIVVNAAKPAESSAYIHHVMVLFSILPPGSLINYWLQIAIAQKLYSFWAIANLRKQTIDLRIFYVLLDGREYLSDRATQSATFC
ncbi:hypothetical protein LC613_34585 [Nostoc sphaeroides CHAB 2801]|uniref:hypothetical protein n=1 Tax=Nostoc sphaeroides TaxID=446679 RepID=UPI001E513E11|nr:hypothetical protein [Nostoc sphaeroides]MCC5632717.1 hypothetical protein [Nostoc sphaeroides CHAB 2801]